MFGILGTVLIGAVAAQAAKNPEVKEKITEAAKSVDTKAAGKAVGITAATLIAGPVGGILTAAGLGVAAAKSGKEKAEAVDEAVRTYQEAPEEFKLEAQKALEECEAKLKYLAEKYNVKQ